MKHRCKRIALAVLSGFMVLGAALPLPVADAAPQKQEQPASAWRIYDDGAFTVRWKVEENTAKDKIVSLEFRSKSKEKFSLGWVDDPQFILTTEAGDFPTKEVSPRLTNFNRKFDMSPIRLRLTFREARGAAQSLLITHVFPLENGLPAPGYEGIELKIDLTAQE